MVERAHTAESAGTALWPHIMEPLRHVGHRIAEFFAPTADASSAEDSYEINMELPGVAAADVQVELHGANLMVKGEKRFEREEKGRTYYFSERRFGSFQRSFRLPEDVAGDEVAASFKDGVLTIRIPRRKPHAQGARRIHVQSS